MPSRALAVGLFMVLVLALGAAIALAAGPFSTPPSTATPAPAVVATPDRSAAQLEQMVSESELCQCNK
ncbi:MAG TPA: hypothetical protein VG370_12950 [Chloroflexota bacterium]|jgi:hypothetical protein|nr:hypothetical protein [Chloroflexota bacterium]